jgi:hypothetical protein
MWRDAIFSIARIRELHTIGALAVELTLDVQASHPLTFETLARYSR